MTAEQDPKDRPLCSSPSLLKNGNHLTDASGAGTEALKPPSTPGLVTMCSCEQGWAGDCLCARALGDGGTTEHAAGSSLPPGCRKDPSRRGGTQEPRGSR